MRILKYLFLTLLVPGIASADLTQFVANRLIAPNTRTLGLQILLGTSSVDTDVTGLNTTPANLVAVGSAGDPIMQLGSNSGGAPTLSGSLQFLKTRSTSNTLDANTVVVNGDELGRIEWFGADNTSYRRAARILVTVDGAVTGGSADMPGAIDFQVSPDGSATTASALKIKNTTDWVYTGNGGTQNIVAVDDTKRIFLAGGSGNSNSNGALLQLNGASNSTGSASLSSSTTSSSGINMNVGSSNGSFIVKVNSAADTALTIASTKAATFTDTVTSSRTTDLGWSIVDQTDNQACNTGCTSACVAGQDLAGANKPLVGCGDTTADICLCAGAS